MVDTEGISLLALDHRKHVRGNQNKFLSEKKISLRSQIINSHHFHPADQSIAAKFEFVH